MVFLILDFVGSLLVVFDHGGKSQFALSNKLVVEVKNVRLIYDNLDIGVFMTKLTKRQVQEAYAKSIEILFNKTVRATPEQITPEVIEKVDLMIGEITKCSKALQELSFRLIYKASSMMVGTYVIDRYVENFIQNLVVKQGVAQYGNLLAKWIGSLETNRKHKFCVITARSKWRSAIEAELMGL